MQRRGKRTGIAPAPRVSTHSWQHCIWRKPPKIRETIYVAKPVAQFQLQTLLKSFRFTLICLVLIVASSSLVFVFRPATRAVIVMPLPNAFPTHKPSLLDRCKRAIPLWARRKIDSVRGPRKAIMLNAAIFDLQGASDA